jgi:hypothetical protein
MARQPLGGLGRLIFRGFTFTHFLDTPHSVGLLWTRDQLVAEIVHLFGCNIMIIAVFGSASCATSYILFGIADWKTDLCQQMDTSNGNDSGFKISRPG